MENQPKPSTTAGAEGPATEQAEEEAPTEARLLDIANILGAPTVTVVRSSL
jgi:predicted secreted protein